MIMNYISNLKGGLGFLRADYEEHNLTLKEVNGFGLSIENVAFTRSCLRKQSVSAKDFLPWSSE
jgi:hypothetical protein